jgi:GNAT superfamily N-acetyltransferase
MEMRIARDRLWLLVYGLALCLPFLVPLALADLGVVPWKLALPVAALLGIAFGSYLLERAAGAGKFVDPSRSEFRELLALRAGHMVFSLTDGTYAKRRHYRIAGPGKAEALATVIRPRFRSLEQASRLLPEIVAMQREAGVPGIRWWCDPLTRPPELPDLLRSHGFSPTWSTDAYYWACASDLPGDDPGIEVVRSSDPADLDVYGELCKEATRIPAMEGRDEAVPADERHPAQLFLAHIDGEPRAFGLLGWFGDRGVFLCGAETHPDYRGRGAYRALLRARLSAARDAGAPYVYTMVKQETASPILRRLGLPFLGAFDRYELRFTES